MPATTPANVLTALSDRLLGLHNPSSRQNSPYSHAVQIDNHTTDLLIPGDHHVYDAASVRLHVEDEESGTLTVYVFGPSRVVLAEARLTLPGAFYTYAAAVAAFVRAARTN
jgi:hypothetical protein